MIKLAMWILWLFLLVVLCCLQSSRILITPQLGYFAGFLLQAVFALHLVNLWDLNLSWYTMFILFGGTALFFMVSVLSNFIFSRTKLNKQQDRIFITIDTGKMPEYTFQPVRITKWKLIGFLVFQVVSFVLVILFMLRNLQGGNILEKIANYNYLIKYASNADRIRFPYVLNAARIVSSMSCYIFSYILLHSIIYKYKQYRLLLAINIIIGFLNTGVIGGRLQAVAWILAAWIQAYILWGKSVEWHKRLPIKLLIRICLICILIAVCFQGSLKWIGRESTKDPLEYLSVYLCGQLKNLDIFVREENFGVTKMSTLGRTVAFFIRLFDKEGMLKDGDLNVLLPFRSVNGHSLGNATTAFAYYLLDGGYFGVGIFSALMACFCQLLFCRSIYKKGSRCINIDDIVYSYSFPYIFLSFFGKFFYNEVFSIKLIEMLLICVVLRWFLLQFGIKRIQKDDLFNDFGSSLRGE